MKLRRVKGTITDQTYFVVSVDICGFPCFFRLPEYQYSMIAKYLKMKSDDPALGKILILALQKK